MYFKLRFGLGTPRNLQMCNECLGLHRANNEKNTR
jgi:hypothetical protein